MKSDDTINELQKDLKKTWESLLGPFKLILHHKHDFFLWLMYIVIAGLVGVIINIVKLWIFDGKGFQEALLIDSKAGSFYTFSLVICASLIYPIFRSLTRKEQPEYSLIRTILLTLLIFTDLFCAIFYAFSNISTHKWFLQFGKESYPLDVPQLCFFIIAILLSIYAFGLEYLPLHAEEYHLSDDHLTNQNKNVEKLKEGIGSDKGNTPEVEKSQPQQPFRL